MESCFRRVARPWLVPRHAHARSARQGTSWRHLVSLIAASVIWTLSVSTGAEAQPKSPTAASPRLSSGWAALEAGRLEDAARVAAQLLDEAPDDHSVQLLLTAALSRGPNPVEALDRLEGWAARYGASDVRAAATIGEGVLVRLADSAAESAVRLAAAEALVEFRALGARALLARVAEAAGGAGLAALAREGDEQAARRLLQQAGTLPGSARVDALERVTAANLQGALEALVAATRSPDEMVRAAAARGLGELGDPAGIAALEPLLDDAAGVARQAAALALATLGDRRGDGIVGAMLNSGVSDIVLTVAEAFPDNVPFWIDQVTPLLQTEDPTDRLRAAALLFGSRRAEAEAAILGSLASENPAIREEAAGTANQIGLAPGPATLRDMLGDPSERVKLAAGKALLAMGSRP